MVDTKKKAGRNLSHALAQAVDYALGQRVRLTQFLKHPEIELSNNIAENSMRLIAAGQKDWIDIGSVEAGGRWRRFFRSRRRASDWRFRCNESWK